ncbi:MAG: hypothetical protein JW955_17585 [Sedimentisphaerales bacterium]|nr:hypothetical protein [Sedimentisphaerales bacterium]
MNHLEASDPPLTLYLVEEEREADSGFATDLILTICASPSGRALHFGRTISLTKEEAVELSCLGRRCLLRRELWAKFDIHGLSSRPGYPKGPLYYVDKDVYDKIKHLSGNSPGRDQE